MSPNKLPFDYVDITYDHDLNSQILSGSLEI